MNKNKKWAKKSRKEFMKDLAILVQSFSDNLEEYRKLEFSIDEIKEFCELDFAIHRTIMLQKYEDYLTFEQFMKIIHELMEKYPENYSKSYNNNNPQG
ncbi:hypothetical protein [Comamonas sp. HJ-2]